MSTETVRLIRDGYDTMAALYLYPRPVSVEPIGIGIVDILSSLARSRTLGDFVVVVVVVVVVVLFVLFFVLFLVLVPHQDCFQL